MTSRILYVGTGRLSTKWLMFQKCRWIFTRDYPSINPLDLSYVELCATELYWICTRVIYHVEISKSWATYLFTANDILTWFLFVSSPGPTVVPKTTEALTDAPETTQAPGVYETTQAPTGVPQTTEALTDVRETTEAATDAPETTQAPSDAPETTQAPSDAPETTQALTDAPETTQASTGVPETTQTPTGVVSTDSSTVVTGIGNFTNYFSFSGEVVTFRTLDFNQLELFGH